MDELSALYETHNKFATAAGGRRLTKSPPRQDADAYTYDYDGSYGDDLSMEELQALLEAAEAASIKAEQELAEATAAAEAAAAQAAADDASSRVELGGGGAAGAGLLFPGLSLSTFCDTFVVTATFVGICSQDPLLAFGVWFCLNAAAATSNQNCKRPSADAASARENKRRKKHP
jgi:predicted lipid-binding transport protein (Tim44 family)